MSDEDDRVAVRFHVRRALRLLVEEAKRQDCLEDVRHFPDVFVALVVLVSPTIGEAVALGMVTVQEVRVWLGMLLNG